MFYKKINGTDLNPSAICLGTAEMGSVISKDDAFQMMDAFFDRGGNILDTAHVYANWLPIEKSMSEKTIGLWMKERKNREKVIISTKGAHPELTTMNVPRLSREEILQDLEESLEFLQTDYIDIYWLHRDDENRPVGEILECLNEQVLNGKIRYFGCSNWKAKRIDEAKNYTEKHGLQSFAASQIMWSLAVPNKEAMGDPTIVYMSEEERAFYDHAQMTVFGFTSQARGFFSKMKKDDLSQVKDWVRSTYDNEENRRRYDRIQVLKKELSVSEMVIVIAYLTAHPIASIPIIGSQSLVQMLESLEAADLRLTPEMVRFLESGK